MNTQRNKKPVQPLNNDSLIEQMRDITSGIGKQVTSDLIGGVTNDALSSLFGTPKAQKSGDLQPGQEIQLNQTQQPQENARQQAYERFPFPFRKKEQIKPQFSQEQLDLLKQQEAMVSRKIEEIRMELKQLIAEIKSVDKEIQKAVSSEFVDPGAYHLSFLDRLKAMLKLMVKEMHQSNNWLTAQKSRKKQMGYWSMYKKKGTSFGLSNERAVASQVG